MCSVPVHSGSAASLVLMHTRCLQDSAASSRAQIAFSVVHHEGKGALSSGWNPGRYGVATGYLQQLHRQLHVAQDDESPTAAAGFPLACA